MFAVDESQAYLISDEWVDGQSIPTLRIVDITNPMTPIEQSTLHLEQIRAVAELEVVDKRLSIAAHTVDASDPTAPRQVGTYRLATEQLAVVGPLIYAATLPAGSDPPGFLLIDASTPAEPRRIGYHPSGGSAVAVVDGLIYLLARDSLQRDTLQVVQVTEVGSPTPIPTLFSTSPPPPPAPPDAARCFAETSLCISRRIRTYWEQHGGLSVFGLPITPLRTEMIGGQQIEVQWFQHHHLELHPTQPPPYNVQLGHLGSEVLVRHGRHSWETEFPRSEPQEGCHYVAASGHNICGAFLEVWCANGIELDGQPGFSDMEHRALFGLPLSDAHPEEVYQTQEYTVQWFERARFELHPENDPPYHVQQGLLGLEIIAPQQLQQHCHHRQHKHRPVLYWCGIRSCSRTCLDTAFIYRSTNAYCQHHRHLPLHAVDHLHHLGYPPPAGLG